MDEVIDQILKYHTVAVVGLSTDNIKPSHTVAEYIQKQGYRIIPVNPDAEMILGEKAYPNLADIPCSIDIVNVFRRAEFCEQIAKDAVRIGARALWLQWGIVNETAAEIARGGDMDVVMNRCIAEEVRKRSRKSY